MDLEKLLKTTPETLASEQHDALKTHIIAKLMNVVNLIKSEEYKKIESLTEFSPAGDCMGCDNSYINFGFGEEPLDIHDVVSRLQELKKITKKS